MELNKILEKQKKFFQSGATLDVNLTERCTAYSDPDLLKPFQLCTFLYPY